MATRTTILKDKFSLLDHVTDPFKKGGKRYQSEFLGGVLDLLKEYDISDGAFKFTDRNFALINQLKKGVNKILEDSAYQHEVTQFLTKFPEVTKANKALFELEDLDPSKVPLSKLQKLNIQQTQFMLFDAGVDRFFTNPVRDILHNSIVNGSNFQQAEKALRDFIKGQDGKLGVFQRWVPQVVQDAINQHDGSIQTHIKEAFKLDGWSYEGSLIEDSRPQCVRWVGQGVIKDKDLPKELSWAFKNGSGMVPATTPDTFAVYRGGYNCRHHATAIRIKKVKPTPTSKIKPKPTPPPVVTPPVKKPTPKPPTPKPTPKPPAPKPTPPVVTPPVKKPTPKPKVNEFVPAKTIQEAEKQTNNLISVDRIVYEGLDKKETEKFGGVLSKREALAKLNKINEEYFRLKRDFPNLPIPRVNRLFVTGDKRGLATSHPRAKNRMVISFANEWDNKLWSNIENWEKQTGGKWDWLRGESHTRVNVRHELGHNLQAFLEIERDPRWLKLKKKYPKRWRKENVSGYAASKTVEFFTEAFSQYTSPIYKDNPARHFPKDLTDFFDLILEGKF